MIYIFLQACHDAYGMPCTITSNPALTATRNSIKDTGMMYNAYTLSSQPEFATIQPFGRWALK